jgi:hypothetical protein
VIVLAFHCYNKTPEKNNLRKERSILAHDFRGFSSWSLGPIISESVVKQNLMARCVWQGSFALPEARSKNERELAFRKITTSQTH